MSHLTALLASGSTTSTTVAKVASKSSGSILDPIAKPIAWLLAEIYSVIPNYGVAILVLSVIWMLLIAPLTLKSTRSMLAMQKLQPQLKKLQAQHKDDKQAFAQAQMELFREHNVSPFGSCLPMLLPMPIFLALFRVIDGLSHTVKGPDPSINCVNAVCYDPKYLSHTTRMFKDIVAAHGHLVAFGMDLSKSAFSSHNGFLAALPFWLVLLVMAGTGYFQSAQMMSRNQAAQANPQMQLMKYIPFIFALVCARFPAGVIIYYSMSNVCRIIQQDAMYRFDPKVKALVAQEVAEVEELTEEFDRKQTKSRGGESGTSSISKSNPKPQGRSRFGELLANAQEQQRRNQQAKAGSNGTNGNGTKKPSGPSNGKGSQAPTNRASTPPKARPTGGKTNRKRRGK
jgi:YidC/Oxa1 family membrane protein insertase